MYLCYFIASERYTYVGITNNFKRRLRQHNQEIKGGARYTKRSKNWKPFIQVHGFANHKEVLQFEWAMKHRRKRGHKGQSGRIRTMEYLFSLDRWTRKAPKIKTMDLRVEVNLSKEKYLKLAGITKEEFTRRRKEQGRWVKFSFRK